MLDREKIVDELFAQAVELSPANREKFLAACEREDSANADVLDEVKALLTNYRRADAKEFLNKPFVSVTSQTLRDGQKFEGYRILKLIAEGGMGEVYLAEDEQLKRKVALKLVKGYATKDILRRFHSERQILANLRHPNIAQLYEAGATADGLPFFAMEYVEGKPINDFARDQQLSLPECLKLFRTVCSAVSYAHQNLIIHRDIKPGNILVTETTEPKLLDFGIAKLLQDGADQPEATATLFRAMTPQYASPEQVKGEPVSTASDVYSLGVLLYELLTGQRPYKLKRGTADEITKAICEEEPAKPSTAFRVLTSVGSSGEEKSPTKVGTLNAVNPKSLRGDLDNIILKALRKEPSRRYASVEQFSEDIRRHLEGLPVSARKDTFGYRTSKFFKRNKIAVTAAALIGLILTTGIIATSVGLARARRERARAENGEATNRHLLYAAQMSLAYQAWESANIGRALDLLDAQKPEAGEEDLRGFEWFLLSRLTHERSRTFIGATERILSLAFSPDGDRLVGGSLDGKARIWDVKTGRLLTSFDGQGGQAYRAVYSPDGKYLATGGSGNGSVLIWEAETKQLVRTIIGHTEGIGALAFSPDGQIIAGITADRAVKLWRLDTAKEMADLTGHTASIVSFAFSPDGKTLATASEDHTAKLWGVASGKEVATLRGHSWYVLDAAFSPDGKTLATTGSDGEIKFWDVVRHHETGAIHIEGTYAHSLRFAPDGKTVAVGTADNTVRIYDVATRKLSDILRGHTDYVFSVAFSPDGKKLASGSSDRTVRLWDLTKEPGALTLDGHEDWAWQVAFSPDGRSLASASKDGTVKLWDVINGRETATLTHPQWVNGLAFSPDGFTLATANDDGLVRLWNPVTGQIANTLNGHKVVVESVTFSPDGKLLASGGKTGEIKLWDTATGKEVAALHSPYQNIIWSLAFSPDGKYVAAGEGGLEALWITTGHVVTIWDTSSRQIVKTLQSHVDDVRAIAFSPDGKFLASGSFDATIKIWDTAHWQEVVTLKTHKVQGLAFSADGKRLVSGGRDKTVKLWDVATWQELCTLTVPSEINSVAFSPDNKILAAASNDNKVRLWFADKDVR